MAVVKKYFRVSKFEGGGGGEVSTDSMSTDEDELRRQSSGTESSNEEEYDVSEDDDVDSGMGSDDVDLSELGEIGEELCQVGNQTCSVPYELYDLPDLSGVLSMDVWNDLLTEEERFWLAQYLPDMDQETFVGTLKELFSGGNFHFGSPVAGLFDMLKGGLCEPRVALYRQGFNFFQKRKHYHHLQKYQNYMVVNLLQAKEAWANCKGYSIQEKLRVLNLRRSQKNLTYEKMEDVGMDTDSSEREEMGEDLWVKRPKNMGRNALNRASPTVDVSSRGTATSLEPAKYGRQNPKGILKLAGTKVSSERDLFGGISANHHLARPYTFVSNSHMQEPFLGYDSGTNQQGSMAKSGLLKVGKKNNAKMNSSSKNNALHSQMKNHNQMALPTDKYYRESIDYYSRDAGKKMKYSDKFQHSALEDKTKRRGQHQLLKGSPLDWSAGNHRFRYNKTEDEPMDHSGNFDDWQDIRTKKAGKNNVHYDHRTSMSEVSDTLFPSDRSKVSQKKIKREPVQNGMNMEGLRRMSQFTHSDETESDSSEQDDSEEDADLLRNKWAYPGGVPESRRSSTKSAPDSKQISRRAPDGIMHPSRKVDIGERLHMPDVELHSLNGKQKGKLNDPRYLNSYDIGILEKSNFSGLGKVNSDDRKSGNKLVKNGHFRGEPGESLQRSWVNAHSVERNQKGKVDHGYPVYQSSYEHDLLRDVDSVPTERLGKRGKISDDRESSVKKRKKMDTAYMDGPDEYDNLDYSPEQQVDEPSSFKKRAKRKVEAESVSSPIMNSEKTEVEPEIIKPVKKPFIFITPTVHTGFSFSIIHLLTAIRVALTTPVSEDVSGRGNQSEKSDADQKPKDDMRNGIHETINGETQEANMDVSTSERIGLKNLPSLTVQELVNRVRSNPGDPSILETQEPLQDLVRGVLKIFSSKTAPLGAKGWKTLVMYEKTTKSWVWIGPVSPTTSDPNSAEEKTSSEAWGLPHKLLVKLVDSFANWLKNGQETLQQIGSLPAPPLSLMQPNLDEKERFRDLRAQKSLTTISPSSEEVRAYFRKEEVLRYLVPDRAFLYTAADGRKSIVAPLRRCGGKPTSKARDHPILKPDRPPHVTILCLVRDAAARLPGSIGTRADVCTLIRDSQYIVEDVSDSQVNQVVSGALDRLHYERDPCVQFDGERKLWVYLHREREEEDFEDDGTSSTKKWKRPRKDVGEQPDPGTVNVAHHGGGERIAGGSDAAYEHSSDLNVERSSLHPGERSEFIYSNLKLSGEENTGPFAGSGQGTLPQGHMMSWEVPGLNSQQENNLLCDENPINENYDNQAFNRDRPVGIVTAAHEE